MNDLRAVPYQIIPRCSVNCPLIDWKITTVPS
jgi:hypothetical protein